MENETLQTLITKFLDGEITSDERKFLQTHLGTEPEAQKLFQQMEQLNHHSQHAVTEEVFNKGRPFDEIFDKAWQHAGNVHVQRPVRFYRCANFAAGLAAGLMIGLAAHFFVFPDSSSTPTSSPVSTISSYAGPRVIQDFPRHLSRPPVIHNVDWYHLTNKAGEQWLIEGCRDELMTPAVYHGAL
jgi:hypothetical protein